MTESRHSFQGKPIGAGRAQTATDVGVVVVTFRSAQTIRHCLELLLASDAVVRIVVVDNASDDGTLALLDQIAGEQERITLVKNADNRGFAAACNQGSSALATPWVAFVNPDCYVEPEAMLRLVLYGIDRAGAGMIGADLVDEDGVPDPAARRRDPSLRELLGQAGRRRDLYLGRDPNMDLQQVEAISGALMLMPLGLFLQLGGFDEAFRLHVEDLDLCRRTREAGYEVLGGDGSEGHLVHGIRLGPVQLDDAPRWHPPALQMRPDAERHHERTILQGDELFDRSHVEVVVVVMADDHRRDRGQVT